MLHAHYFFILFTVTVLFLTTVYLLTTRYLNHKYPRTPLHNLYRAVDTTISITLLLLCVWTYHLITFELSMH